MTYRACLLLLAGVVIAAAAPADIVPTAQTRSVQVTSQSRGDLWLPGQSPTFPDFHLPSYSQSASNDDNGSAPDFEPYDETVSVVAPGIVPVPTAGTSSASLTSTISTWQLTASGELSSTADAYVLSQATLDFINMFLPPGTYWLGFGSDHNDGAVSNVVDFDVTTDTPYTLAGSLVMQAADPLTWFVGSHFGNLLVRLTGPSGVLHETIWDQVFDGCAISCSPADFLIDEAGVLTPGSYTLEVGMNASAWGGCGDVPGAPPCWLPVNSGSFDITLTAGTPPGCPPSPAPGCIAADKARLIVKENVDGREKLRASLKRFASATTQSDLGDPVSGVSRYAVCIYDDADTLVGELEVDRAGEDCGTPAAPCWQPISSTGFKYRDRDAAASGVQLLLGKSGAADRGRLRMRARNNASKGQTTMPQDIASQLQGASSATLQVLTSDAACFGTTLSTVKTADGQHFRARTP